MFRFDSRTKFLMMVLILVLVGVAAYVVFVDDDQFEDLTQTKDRSLTQEDIDALRPSIVNEFEGFTASSEISKVDESEKEDKKIYIKGELIEQTDLKLKIKSNSEVREVYLQQDELALRCEPEFYTDKNGKQMPANQVFIDYSSLDITKEIKVSKKALVDTFSIGDEVIIVARRGADKLLYAELIAGYGCESLRELKQ